MSWLGDLKIYRDYEVRMAHMLPVPLSTYHILPLFSDLGCYVREIITKQYNIVNELFHWLNNQLLHLCAHTHREYCFGTAYTLECVHDTGAKTLSGLLRANAKFQHGVCGR